MNRIKKFLAGCTAPVGSLSLRGAIKADCTTFVKILLNLGVDSNILDSNGTSPLCLAIRKGNIAIVKSLLDHGAAVDIADYYSPLSLAIWEGNIAIVNSLLDHVTDVNFSRARHNSHLHFAIHTGDIAIVNSLIKHGADVNIQDYDHYSPLKSAISLGSIAIVNSLLDHGADVNDQNPEHSSPLKLALEKGNIAIFNKLLDHGATDQELEENIGLISNEMITVRTFIQENDPERLVQYRRSKDFTSKLTAVENKSSKFKNVIKQQFLLAKKQALCTSLVGSTSLKIVFEEEKEDTVLPREIMERISYYLTEGDSNTFIRARLDPAKITENCNALSSCTETSNIFTNLGRSCGNFFRPAWNPVISAKRHPV